MVPPQRQSSSAADEQPYKKPFSIRENDFRDPVHPPSPPWKKRLLHESCVFGSGMTEAQIRVVDRSVQQMELGGVGLEGEVGKANDVEFRGSFRHGKALLHRKLTSYCKGYRCWVMF